MSYLDNTLAHAKHLVTVLEDLIQKEKGFVEKQKVIDAIAEYYNSLHSWEEADVSKLIYKIREL